VIGMSEVSSEKFYSVVEAAEMMRVSPWSVRSWLRLGKLRACKIGARVVIPASALSEFIRPRPVSLKESNGRN
jgi:excisionase family DNA binding protein